MRFSHCFLRGSVVKNLSSTEKYQAIHELIHKASVFAEIRSLNKFEEAVFEREKLQTTGIGRGVAVAHGRLKHSEKLLIALGVSREGIEFDSIDSKPVHFLFVIATAENDREEYLKVLSSIIRSIRNESLRDHILTACTQNTSQDEIEETLRSSFLNSLDNSIDNISPKRASTVA